MESRLLPKWISPPGKIKMLHFICLINFIYLGVPRSFIDPLRFGRFYARYYRHNSEGIRRLSEETLTKSCTFLVGSVLSVLVFPLLWEPSAGFTEGHKRWTEAPRHKWLSVTVQAEETAGGWQRRLTARRCAWQRGSVVREEAGELGASLWGLLGQAELWGLVLLALEMHYKYHSWQEMWPAPCVKGPWSSMGSTRAGEDK